MGLVAGLIPGTVMIPGAVLTAGVVTGLVIEVEGKAVVGGSIESNSVWIYSTSAL
ncbi:hypothetical protein HanXRQr2_Chr06g0267711 [Helianthus annuus]|uniref:Uncharacterized protein n=1 Tax=Helianthus annuus TaxID=4232 RepID=A0A9K3IUJ2_HELAN|nr:hypothetical protein HanXRQr2_Chr06g0267711 [Helianthus annuus]KAJ0916143.1 hypothetical protein HanPSC8_Chr06g0258221 [Helianthus annuus]